MKNERLLASSPVARDALGWTDIIGKLKSLQYKVPNEIVDIRPTVCNIEGDRPGYNAIKVNPNTRWANLVVTLDSPLSIQSKVHYIFDELLRKQTKHHYKSLEACIPEFNQLKVLLIELIWISYYIDLSIENKVRDKTPKMTIQVHQRSNETDQLNNFINYLSFFYKENFECLINEENYKKASVTINNASMKLYFKYGYDTEKDLNEEGYCATQVPIPGTNYYLSFSMGIGYDPSITPSDIFYPNRFFYLDTDSNTLYDYPAYRDAPETTIPNDFIRQFEKPNFEMKFRELANQWISLLISKKFKPEGKDVFQYDKIDLSSLMKFRMGSVGKLAGIWNADPQGEYPIKSWKV